MAKQRKKSNKSTGRDYTYDTVYQASPTQKKRRAKRNAARRKLMDEDRVRKGDGKDVNHKNASTLSNASSNLNVEPKSVNRARKKKRKK